MIDYETLEHWPVEPIEHTQGVDFSMLYALAVGVGTDPTDARFPAPVFPGETVRIGMYRLLRVPAFEGWLNRSTAARLRTVSPTTRWRPNRAEPCCRSRAHG